MLIEDLHGVRWVSSGKIRLKATCGRTLVVLLPSSTTCIDLIAVGVDIMFRFVLRNVTFTVNTRQNQQTLSTITFIYYQLFALTGYLIK